MQRIDLDEEIRVAIVGAGGYGRVALDVLLASGLGDRVLGFYDDAHAALSGELRGVPILGDVAMLKSMLSVEPVHVGGDHGQRGAAAGGQLATGFGRAVPHDAPSRRVPLWRGGRRRRLRVGGWGRRAPGRGCGEPLFRRAGGDRGSGRRGGGGNLDLCRVRRGAGSPRRGAGRPRPELERRPQGGRQRRRGGRCAAAR